MRLNRKNFYFYGLLNRIRAVRSVGRYVLPLQNSMNILGGKRDGVTPVPIPNTAVKPVIVDGTAWETVWESRTSPGLN